MFAIDQFFMGEAAQDGTSDPNAWRVTGFNLDGLDSQDAAHLSCIPGSGSSRNDTLDGDCGVDNQWGRVLQRLLLPGQPSTTQTARARAGRWTWLIRVDGLDGSADQKGVSGAVYVGAPTSTRPQFDGSDVWPPSQDMPAATFTAAYFAGGALVIKEPLALPFEVSATEDPMNPVRWRFPVKVTAVQLTFTADLRAITHGVVAGIAAMQDVVGGASPLLCGGPLGGKIPFADYTDILTNGTTDPTKICDGYSFAVGITAKAVTLGAPSAGLPAPPACNSMH